MFSPDFIGEECPDDVGTRSMGVSPRPPKAPPRLGAQGVRITATVSSPFDRKGVQGSESSLGRSMGVSPNPPKAPQDWGTQGVEKDF